MISEEMISRFAFMYSLRPYIEGFSRNAGAAIGFRARHTLCLHPRLLSKMSAYDVASMNRAFHGVHRVLDQLSFLDLYAIV